MIYKFLNYLNIRKIGFLELIVALYPILVGYGYGTISLDLLILLILCLYAFIRRQFQIQKFPPLLYFAIFVIIHDIIWLVVIDDIGPYYVHLALSQWLHILSIFFIGPLLNKDKLLSSINIVGWVCFGGLIYHIIILMNGGIVNPLKLPFLPEMGTESRLFEDSLRPTSFFWEPQSYVMYMIVPMFIYLLNKRYILFLIIAISIFLSTSTTGIIIVCLILLFYILFQKITIIRKLLILIFGVFLIYLLFNSEYMMYGYEKMINTNFETSVRTASGFAIAKTMTFPELLLGVPYSNVDDYVFLSGVSIPNFTLDPNKIIFVAGFWSLLIRYGFGGVVLFIYIYIYIMKKIKYLVPYILVLLVTLFSNPDYIGPALVFQMCLFISIINFNSNEKNIYSNNTICK